MKWILLAYRGADEETVALERTAGLAREFDAEVGEVSIAPFRHGRRGGTASWDDQLLERLLEASVLRGSPVAPPQP